MCLTEFDEKKYAETLMSDGYEQGLADGREEAIHELIITLLADGKTPEQIQEFLHYPIELIEKVSAETQKA